MQLETKKMKFVPVVTESGEMRTWPVEVNSLGDELIMRAEFRVHLDRLEGKNNASE